MKACWLSFLGLGFLLFFACAAPQAGLETTPTPTPSPSPGVPPLSGKEYRGVIIWSELEGKHLELHADDGGSYVLLPSPNLALQGLLERLAGTGIRVKLWGEPYQGPTIYMRPALRVYQVLEEKPALLLPVIEMVKLPCTPTYAKCN